MRQLKGKVKENAREKRERKKEFMENKEKAFSIGKISVSDPDPGWIWLQSVQWDPYSGSGSGSRRAVMTHWLPVLYGGLGMGKLQLLIQKY
jgi:hypothetical protein